MREAAAFCSGSPPCALRTCCQEENSSGAGAPTWTRSPSAADRSARVNADWQAFGSVNCLRAAEQTRQSCSTSVPKATQALSSRSTLSFCGKTLCHPRLPSIASLRTETSLLFLPKSS